MPPPCVPAIIATPAMRDCGYTFVQTVPLVRGDALSSLGYILGTSADQYRELPAIPIVASSDIELTNSCTSETNSYSHHVDA